MCLAGTACVRHKRAQVSYYERALCERTKLLGRHGTGKARGNNVPCAYSTSRLIKKLSLAAEKEHTYILQTKVQLLSEVESR